MQATYEAEDFWSDTYRGRVIAILDHVLQPRMQFDSAEAAVNWLQRKVDRPTARSRLH
jgi:hypothetical protein